MINKSYIELLENKVVNSVIVTGPNKNKIYGRIEMVVKPIDCSIHFFLFIEESIDPYRFRTLQEALALFDEIA